MNDQIICSGALLYSLDSKRFLFLHRANGKHKNVWGLVGGTNEGVETPWEGLRREIDEEIGKVEIKKTGEVPRSEGKAVRILDNRVER